MKLTELDDEALVAQAAREGSDGGAFVELVARHRERVWRICYRLLGNEHDAADAAQEVFVRLYLHRARFEGRSRFTTWLHAIAVRTCLGLRRGRGRRRRHEDAAAAVHSERIAVQPSEPEAAGQLSPELRELLDSLSEEDRAMVILKYAEDYSFEELAEMFELGVSACKMRVRRACERIERQHADAPDRPASAPSSKGPAR